MAEAVGTSVSEVPIAATASNENVTAALPVKRRGRPKGSKNKAKEGESSAKKPRISKSKGTGQMTKLEVNNILKARGVTNVSKVSKCLRAAILNGSIKLLKPGNDPNDEYGLNQTIYEAECPFCCEETVTCTIKDVLYQPDYGGADYEMGGEEATVHCEGEDCAGIYVTNMCCGDPSFDSGKFHNHCGRCPNFGVCIGDYREMHCSKCGGHYFCGGYGGRCPCSRK